MKKNYRILEDVGFVVIYRRVRGSKEELYEGYDKYGHKVILK